ncbi:MAG: hypothetical protein V1838_03220 [Patescibacteria group bacterium]
MKKIVVTTASNGKLRKETASRKKATARRKKEKLKVVVPKGKLMEVKNNHIHVQKGKLKRAYAGSIYEAGAILYLYDNTTYYILNEGEYIEYESSENCPSRCGCHRSVSNRITNRKGRKVKTTIGYGEWASIDHGKPDCNDGYWD